MEILRDYKQKVEKLFKEKNIDTHEVNFLFCESLGCNFSNLLEKEKLSKSETEKINIAVKKRILGEPIQKIFKRAYFFDYVFYINKNVLCPRPETELLVEESLKYIDKNSNILDLCTGSGAIAITVQKKTGANVVASDISEKALYIARKNAKQLSSKIKFVKSDMFKKISKKFDIIISNPPYIPSLDCQKLEREVKDYDPIISLDGGEDGLKFYKIIASEARKFLNGNGKLFLEVGKGEADKVCKLLSKNGFVTHIKKDYNKIDRIVVGEIK